MKKIILSLLMALGLAAGAHAGGGGIAWDKFPQEKANDLGIIVVMAAANGALELYLERKKPEEVTHRTRRIVTGAAR